MAQASTIALLQPPPSRCLASYADSDWVLKQKLREEHGLKLNRHQRKNRFKLVNTDVEYHGDDEVPSSKHSSKMKTKAVSKAIIASGTGPDGRAEERKIRKRRRMIVRSVAVVLLSVFAAMAKNHFSPPTGDTLHQMPQRQAGVKEVLPKKDMSASMPDLSIVDETCEADSCFEKEKPSDTTESQNEIEIERSSESLEETVPGVSSDKEDVPVCENDEVSCFFVHQA
jgi:hypothetical protein